MLKFIKKTRKRLRSADLENFQNLNDKKKSILLNIFFLVLSTMLVFFVILSILQKNYTHTLIDALVLTSLLVVFILFKIKQKLFLASHFFVLILLILSIFYTYTGGVNDTGLIFVILLPLPTIMLMGRKPGTIVISCLFIFLLASVLLFNGNEWFANYNQDFALRVFICYLVITLLAYLNESVFDVLYNQLKNTTNSLQQSQENYKNLALNREKFLSILSHELKNQVYSFNSATEILKNNYEELHEKEKQELLEMLSDSSRKNVQLLQDLLKWSMLKNQSFPFNPVSIKLEQIYREVIGLLNQETEKKEISVFLTMRSNSEVYADYDMLNAIMRNLFTNAIKFTNKGGEVKIIATEVDDMMKLEIKDNGNGMDQETLSRIKNSIATSSLEKSNEFGAGFGLLLVKEFVEWNKGQMDIKSKLGEGTTITFTLPLAD